MNEMESLDIASVEQETFNPHLNSQFTIATEDGGESVVLVLEGTSEYPDHRPSDQQTDRKPFALVFSCATHPLEQGTYHLKHDALSPFLVFLSPFEAYENGHKLEAIFA